MNLPQLRQQSRGRARGDRVHGPHRPRPDSALAIALLQLLLANAPCLALLGKRDGPLFEGADVGSQPIAFNRRARRGWPGPDSRGHPLALGRQGGVSLPGLERARPEQVQGFLEAAAFPGQPERLFCACPSGRGFSTRDRARLVANEIALIGGQILDRHPMVAQLPLEKLPTAAEHVADRPPGPGGR